MICLHIDSIGSESIIVRACSHGKLRLQSGEEIQTNELPSIGPLAGLALLLPRSDGRQPA